MQNDVDTSQIQWSEPGAQPKIDPAQIRWQSPAVDTSQIKWGSPTAKKQAAAPSEISWGAPTGHRPDKWLYSVGPNDVMGDYRQTWTKFGGGGIRGQFRDYIDSLGNSGFAMGVYDFDRGHHFAPNDPHLDGRAVDVDTINGEGVGTQLTPRIGQFITTALAISPYARVGVPKEIYAQLPKALQQRAFVDNAGHVHVELSQDGIAHGKSAIPPNTRPLAGISTAGLQLPITKHAIKQFEHEEAQHEAKIRALLSVLQRVPLKEGLDVLGAPQRAVGMGIYGAQQGHDFGQIAHDVWQGLTDADTSRHATDSVRALLSFGHGAIPGGMTREQVQDFINEHDVPPALRPYLSAAMNTAEDFEAQTISDPLTYIGGLGVWAKGIKLGVLGLGQGARMLAGIDDAARAWSATGRAAPGLINLFKQPVGVMTAASLGVRRVAGKVGGQIQETFTVRPDLDDFSHGQRVGQKTKPQAGGFTPEGKQRRMAIENSELKQRNDGIARDQEAARHPAKPNQALAARYLRLMYQHGSQADSDFAANALGLQRNASPTGWLAGSKGLGAAQNTVRDILSIGKPNSVYTAEDALGALSKGRQRVRMYQTARRTDQMVKQFPDSLKAGSTPTTEEDWRGVAMDPKRAKRDDNWFQKIRELQRANVMVFPFAHGIVNVGQLSYLGAPEHEGLRVVLDGFRYMLGRVSKGKIPGSAMPDEAMLTRFGAGQTYVHEHEAPGLWRNWPAALGGQVVKNHIINMQSLLGHMETGWRMALWDALKRNPATSKLDDLTRGAMVAERAGDPRNVAGFVRMFELFGGPFVAYRLGIVPAAVLRAIRDNPQRVLAAIRPVLDLQDNRSKRAQEQNTFMLNMPVENAMRLFGPGFINYLASPSTIGLFGLLERFTGGSSADMPWAESIVNTLSAINPFEQPMNIAGWLWPHAADSELNPMPGQKMSLVDHLMGAMMAPFASFYFAKNQNPKYAAQRYKRSLKEIEKFEDDFLDMLQGKGQ